MFSLKISEIASTHTFVFCLLGPYLTTIKRRDDCQCSLVSGLLANSYHEIEQDDYTPHYLHFLLRNNC